MTRPRRFALFLPSLRGGGAERVMVDIAGGLAQRGHAIDLLLAQCEGPYLTDVPAAVHLVDLRAARTGQCLPTLARFLRRERLDAILSTHWHANVVSLWARLLAARPLRVVLREANTPSQTSLHAKEATGRLMLHLQRAFYPHADLVIAPSQGVAEELRTKLKLAEARVRVIHNPVVTPSLARLCLEPLDHPFFENEHLPVILGVGRLTKQKDFATLLRAFQLVRRQRPSRLVVLGEGRERTALESLASTLGIDEDVSFPGFVTNPFAYMARAKLFVLSSAWEGLPNALIQALACGCPAVATDCPSGSAEILGHGQFGPLVPVGDEGKLAEAMLSVLQSPTAPEHLVHASAPFRLDAVIGHFEAALSGTHQ